MVQINTTIPNDACEAFLRFDDFFNCIFIIYKKLSHLHEAQSNNHLLL